VRRWQSEGHTERPSPILAVESWFDEYRTMPAELKAALDKITTIPVDIDPIISFVDDVR
jgi:hypothetical protein